MCSFAGDIQINGSGLGVPGTPTDAVSETRRMLGIPTDRPVIATGHQPVAPHPGILAKYIAARHLADGLGGLVVNLVVDTVDILVGAVEIPLSSLPLGLRIEHAQLLRESSGVLSARPAGAVVPWTEGPAMSAATCRGLAVLASAWSQAEGATAGAQAGSMVRSLMRPMVGDVVNVFASELLATPIGLELIEAIRRDPSGCLRAWNDACIAHPDAGVGRLRAAPEFEVPLWVLEAAARRPATVRDLEEPQTLLPRGLVTSAIMRRAGCDAWVHGRGGWSYDRVMEDWIQGWLGWPLAGRCLVTADVRLPGCREADLAAAEQSQRRRRHDPASGGAPGLSWDKATMLEQIGACPRGSQQRRHAWLAMHRWLDREAGHRTLRGDAAVARKRDWAFPLYPEESIEGLVAAVSEAISEAEVLPDSMPC